MTKTFDVRSAIRSENGLKKKNNEDYADSFEPEDAQDLGNSGRLYLVADGVGGASMGERASRYAVQKVLHDYYLQPNLEPGERLKQAMRQANSQIFQFAEQSSPPVRMATTMVCAVILGNRLTVASVGDSRVYLIRNQEARQITRDHSTFGELVRDGTLSEEEALHSKRKNTLYRAIGAEEDVSVDVFADLVLEAGDKILLCSDGLTRYALAQDIVRMSADGSLEEIAQRLADFANQSGGADNVTVIVIEIHNAGSAGRTAARGRERPGNIKLDEMETQPYTPSRRRARVVMLTRSRMLWMVAITFVTALGMTLGIGFLIASNETPEPSALIETSASPTPEVEAKPSPTNFAPDPTQPAESQPGSTPGTGPAVQPQVTGTATLNGGGLEGICVYRVIQGDSVSKIMEKFEQQFFSKNKYSYRECQETTDHLLLCTEQTFPIEDENMISINQYIQIPNLDQETCTSKGGLWASVTKAN